MIRQSLIVCSLLLLCACGSSSDNGNNRLYGMMDNDRQFGVVISVQQASHLLSDDSNELEYVIQKDDGSKVTITQTPAVGETIVYPGQKAIIQKNGKYLRVYAADVEHSRDGRY